MAGGWPCSLRKALPFALRFRKTVPLVVTRAIHVQQFISQQQNISESYSEERTKSASESGKKLKLGLDGLSSPMH